MLAALPGYRERARRATCKRARSERGLWCGGYCCDYVPSGGTMAAAVGRAPRSITLARLTLLRLVGALRVSLAAPVAP